MANASHTISDSESTIVSRPIIHRTHGTRHGMITGLMRPGDLGEAVKPFVALDLFEADDFSGRSFPPHPHSGIATLTVFLEGRMTYADTTGKIGALTAGAVEWMQAGSGVWHAGEPTSGHPMRGYQLWVALPPALELAPAQSLYLEPGRIESVGPARVLLGQYEGKTSLIPAPTSITYLHVRLEPGARWAYQPAAEHDVAWLAVNAGRLRTAGTKLEREMAVFAEGNGAIALVAESAVEFVIGSASKHPYPLVSGYYSIHTNSTALITGEANIAHLQKSDAMRMFHQAR